jgi:anti-sigma factor RsiW
MNCEVTMRWLDAYLEGELELTRRLDLEAHLAACFKCKTTAEEAANFESWLRVNMPVYKTPPELKARIQASLPREFRSSSNAFLVFGAFSLVLRLAPFKVKRLNGSFGPRTRYLR